MLLMQLAEFEKNDACAVMDPLMFVSTKFCFACIIMKYKSHNPAFFNVSGDTYLGGDEFDTRIVDRLAESFKRDVFEVIDGLLVEIAFGKDGQPPSKIFKDAISLDMETKVDDASNVNWSTEPHGFDGMPDAE
nr:hypothetical protein [Tanacetum cinerariifolium]